MSSEHQTVDHKNKFMGNDHDTPWSSLWDFTHHVVQQDTNFAKSDQNTNDFAQSRRSPHYNENLSWVRYRGLYSTGSLTCQVGARHSRDEEVSGISVTVLLSRTHWRLSRCEPKDCSNEYTHPHTPLITQICDLDIRQFVPQNFLLEDT